MTATLFPTDEEIERIVVGPQSAVWRFGSDVRLYPAMLYPLMLQVAHPVVGAGVHDYSDFDKRPWKRLIGTLDYVTMLIYGGHDAVAMGRRLRALHKQFQGVREDGERYYALEPEAYAWVHATLIEAYVAGHRHFGHPMTPREREQFYREYRGLGRLVGVRERDLPETWAGFQDYLDQTIATELRHTVTVDRVLNSVRHAAPPFQMPRRLWKAMRMPARKMLWVGGIGMCPPEMRRLIGVSWSASEQMQFRALGRATRSLEPVLPRSLKTVGPAQLRMRRRAIARGPLGSAAELSTSSGAPTHASAAA
jgi:uncharacterized protein (DUF2236 family)